jgi:DNA-binding response OmpR family regulator
MLPKLNGFEVCRMLKFDDTYKNIPIIILSALDQQGDREKAIQCGADAYFIKPFDFDLLVTKIRSLLK